MIKLSIKGLAKYILSSPSTQRKILRDFKYPDSEGHVQAVYYREARDCILAHHKNGHDCQWLTGKADHLDQLAAGVSGQTAVRFRHNARGLRAYMPVLSQKAYEILHDLTLALIYGNVRVTVTPDLHVRENGQEKLIKLEFGVDAPDPKLVKIIGQAMFEAAAQGGMNLPASSILYLDVPRHKTHKGARMGARMSNDLEAACQNISAIWNGL